MKRFLFDVAHVAIGLHYKALQYMQEYLYVLETGKTQQQLLVEALTQPTPGLSAHDAKVAFLQTKKKGSLN